MTQIRSGATAVVAVALLIVFSAVPVSAVESGESPLQPSSDLGSTSVLEQTTTPTSTATNETETETVAHRNPSEVDSDTNVAPVRSRLERQLASRLQISVENLTAEEYENASRVLGDSYLRTLAKYEDLEDVDPEVAAAAYEDARERQLAYIGTVEQLRDVGEQYRAAKERGNDTRARQLARELLAGAENTTALAEQLNESYASLQNRTGANFSTSQSEIRRLQQQVTVASQQLRQTAFESTNLSVESDSTRVSFRDPLELTGQLTANGTAVSNREIEVQIGPQRRNVTTDADGEFSLTYRPVTLDVETTELRVRYTPEDQSLYLGSNDTVSVEVEQTQATVEGLTAPNTATFGDPVPVSGTVTVDGEPITGLPMNVSVTTVSLDDTETNETGEFFVNETLPANVDDRGQEIDITSSDELAVVVDSSRDLTVNPTQTALSASIVNRTDTALVVAGTLQTEAGVELANQTLTVTAGGAQVATVNTTASGAYETSVPLEDGALPNGASQLVVKFPDSRSSSLWSSEATVSMGLLGGPGPVAIATGVGGVVLVGTLIVVIRRRELESLLGSSRKGENGGRDEADSDEAGNRSAYEESNPGFSFQTDSDLRQSTVEPTRLLDVADDHLADSRFDEATIVAYTAVRTVLIGRLDATADTPWELYEHAREGGLVEPEGSLYDLTRLYEQVSYGGREATSDDATQALDLATTLVSAVSAASAVSAEGGTPIEKSTDTDVGDADSTSDSADADASENTDTVSGVAGDSVAESDGSDSVTQDDGTEAPSSTDD
ncbi:DUF4129 domain-containing protein [Salinigranum halophilum]|uniref:DUF4129 domain-containing protein n=1 Tax=Salinigranum halophilum TaxID=2565931 RepID=UPI00137633BB|nr:DUF4129 domain-containing protein [Salinigranum halophilum]